MKLMRTLVMCAATNNFSIYSKYVPTKLNDIADSLSRFQMQRFRRLAPNADPTPVKCPTLEEIIWKRT